MVIANGAASTELSSLFCELLFVRLCFLCAVCLCVLSFKVTAYNRLTNHRLGRAFDMYVLFMCCMSVCFLVCTHAQGCLAMNE